MKKLLFLITFNLVLLTLNSFAQQNKTIAERSRPIDSLLFLLKIDKADTNKLIHLNKLSLEYYKIKSYDSAKYYASSTVQLGNTMQNEKANSGIKQIIQKYQASSYEFTGKIFYRQGDYPQSLKNFFAAMKIYESISGGDKMGMATTYNNIGVVYYGQGNYPEALKNYFDALKLRELISDLEGVSSSYGNIGLVYYSQGNFPEALKNHFESLKIKEKIADKKGIANTYNNIGIVYCEQGNFPDALKNFYASLKIKEEIDDQAGIASAYNNIGGIYCDQGNYPEALKKHVASLKIKEALGNKKGAASSYDNIGLIYCAQAERDPNPKIRSDKLAQALKNHFVALTINEAIGNKTDIANSCNNIGSVFTKQKKYKEAAEYLNKSRDLAKEIGLKSSLKKVYSFLTVLDSAKGNYKGAYENHKLFILYRDSLDNEETRKKTIQSQMTFDFEKKEAIADAEHKKELENQQTLAEEKSRKQKVVILFVIIGLLLVLVFAGLIFRSLRLTRKQKNIIEKQKNFVEQQKREVEDQKILIETHQKDIIDSITYSKRLQKAILPSDEEIKKHLNDSFIIYKPKDIVAGDFYWMHIAEFLPDSYRDLKMSQFEKENNANHQIIFIAAADSTGHGVPGAMVSVVCSNALNRAVNEFKLIDTGKILDKTRDLVLETFAKSGEEIKDGMDISLLSLKFACPDELGKNSKLIEMKWSGANNSLCYIQNNNLIEIKANKQAIGKTDNPQPFTTHILEFSQGDTYYLMTDGFADQFGGGKGKKFKYKQLQEKLIALNNLSLAEQKEKLTDVFDDWKGNLEQVDDVTIIGVKI